MAKFKIQKTATTNQYFDSTNVIGGVGGNTGISGNQVRPNVYINGASAAAVGWIIDQKGRSKFLVSDNTYKGQCTLVNYANANLSAGQMSIGVDTAVISYANVNVYVGGSTAYAYVTYLTANVTGPKTPAAGDYLRGTGITGNVVINTVTANTITGQSNANVSLGIAQTVGNLFNQASIYSGGYAQRLSNKFVIDFNNTKYQWKFTDPTATTARIPGA